MTKWSSGQVEALGHFITRPLGHCSLWLLAFGCMLLCAGALSAVEFMTPDQIKVGMKGTGRSVFKGTRIEEFQIEVLGVMPRAYADHDMILVRCSGANLEHTGVIAGMSGSPVYIDGKMIGAVAMTYGFQKDPIAEVTPIEDMIDIMNRTDLPDEGFVPDGPNEAGMAVKRIQGVEGSRGQAGTLETLKPGNLETFFSAISNPQSAIPDGCLLRPIPCPVTVSGLDAQTCATLAPRFEEFGLRLMPGSTEASVSETGDTIDLQPGAAVGVCLIRGDMNASGIGTLTYRDGNRIVAFGHPMFLGGAVNMPMIGGVIHTVLASQELSFKIFSPTAPIGAVRQDRANGIAGTIGEKVPMIPVSVSVRSAGQEHRYHYQVLDHRLLTANLVDMTVANAIMGREQTTFPFTAQMDISIKLRGYPEIHNRRWFSGDGTASGMPSEVSDALRYLLTNEFEKVEVESIGVAIDVSPGTNILTIRRVVADRERVHPGEDIHLAVTLRPYRGPDRTEVIDVAVPKETPEGTLRLLLTTPDTALIAAVTAAGPDGQARSLRQMIKLLERIGNENQLLVQGFLRQRGMYVDGEELPNLPPSMYSILNSRRVTGAGNPTEASLLFEKRVSLDQIVVGERAVEITVEKK